MSPFSHEPFDDLLVPDVEPEERVALASTLASEGQRSFESGDFDTAARQLEVSYRLTPSSDVLLTLGLALAELGHHMAAAERLERYLQGEAIEAEQRGRAEQALSQQRSHFAAVNVSTEPSGARISLDGRPQGTSPLPEPLLLVRGEYLVLAQLEGYSDETERLTVEGGAPVELLLRLQPVGGATEPPPAESDGRGLTIGFWASLGITLASAAAMVTTVVFANLRGNELRDAYYPDSEMSRSASAWGVSSYALSGVTGAAGVVTLVLGLIRALGGAEQDDDEDPS